jgi:methylthioribose-1-phosphate isomerase
MAGIIPLLPEETAVADVAAIIQSVLAPVFLLAGIGAFLNACTGRLARIVDRTRDIEPDLLASRGDEHERLLAEMRTLDRRILLVGRAIWLSVVAAGLTCLVVVLLFAGTLVSGHFGTAIAVLFIASMVALGAAFAVFLIETRLGTNAVRVRTAILEHRADD